MNADKRHVLAYLREKESVKAIEVAEKFNMTLAVTRGMLSRLRSEGKVIMVRNRDGSDWIAR